MTEDAKSEATDLSANRRVLLIRAASIALILFALLSYLDQVHVGFVPLPMRPLEVSPAAVLSTKVPADPGSLRGRDLVLITLDTTRPDRLGCYGNREIDTPTLGRLASEGVIFSNAITTASTTLPSHASILTGLYPHHHGARANGIYALAQNQRTLAEALSRNGYATAAFVSAFVLEERFGLSQGFDRYDDDTGDASTMIGFTERPGNQTTDRAIAWLESPRSRPYFLWVHYFDPHQRHEPPPPFDDGHEHAYDGEIAFVDHEVGRLLKAVESASAAPPLVVVTADHGESLGDHNEPTHGFLAYESTLRIPLIMHAPGAIAGNHHLETRVSVVDLVPTIASLLAVPFPGPTDGVDLTNPPAADRVVIAEAVEGATTYGWAELAAVYRGPMKLIDGPRPELFDVERDPLETRDLARARPREVDRLRRALHENRGRQAALAPPSVTDIDEADIARLEALGYVIREGQPRTPGARGPDPNEMMPRLVEVLDLVSQVESDARMSFFSRWMAQLRGRLKDPESAISLLEEMTVAHPDFAPTYRYLATLQKRVGRSADAEKSNERFEEVIRNASGAATSRPRPK